MRCLVASASRAGGRRPGRGAARAGGGSARLSLSASSFMATAAAGSDPSLLERERRGWQMRRCLSLHRQELDLEDQGGVGGDAGARVATVAEVRRDDEGALAAHLHAGDALVPAADDLAASDGELERGTAVQRAV